MKKNPAHFLSVIIPVYKQEKTIVQNIREIKIVLDKIRYDYEIIAVVDGFLDRSYQLLKSARIPKVKPYGYQNNEGKGNAVRLGMELARGDYVMFIDAGMEIDPNGISMLLEHMEWYDADIIVGSKRHPASVVNYSLVRKLLSYGYYLLVRIAFGLNVHDTQAGIKIFRKKVLKRVLPRLVEKRFVVDLELLVVANHLGYKKIYEAPVKINFKLGNLTRAATWKGIMSMIWDSAMVWGRLVFLGYYNAPRKNSIRAHVP